MESGTANLLHMLEDRVRSLCEAGKWDEARHTADAAIEKARESLDNSVENKHELALSLEVKGDLLRQMGEYREARQEYLEAMDVLGNSHHANEDLGRLAASVAVLYDEEENRDEAKRYYERSIDLFGRIDPPANLDIADLSNNLAFLYEEEENFDRAETLFLNALKICHEELGPKDEETAVICNNVGALYQKAGYNDRACEMHVMALEAREETLGTDHVETGQSHGNLALALAATGDDAGAHLHFDRAIEIYERHLAESPTDYATVVANFMHFLKELGDSKAASALEKRAAKLLKKV
jgi:tetratricopeptide (TPR) repeat protein